MGRDPYRYFRPEAAELLENLGAGALRLERQGIDAPTVAAMLRYAHTLKGAARVVKLGAIADRAHQLEDVLAPLRGAEGEVDPGVIAALLAGIDGLNTLLRDIDAPAPAPADASAAPGPVDGPEVAAPPVPPAAAPVETVRVYVRELDRLLGGLDEAIVRVGGVRSVHDQLEHAQRLARSLTENLGRSDGADARRNRRLRDVAAELRTLVTRAARRLDAGVGRAEAELAGARVRGQALRLVPAARAFQSLERAARDTAQALGREVDFVAHGGDVHVDGQVLTGISEALLHVVRNAIDHGIEPPDERLARGKPRRGRLTLGVVRAGSRARFTCTDDGRGVDAQAVLRAAAARGLSVPPTAQAADGSTPPAVLDLLFAPGLTTASRVSAHSGRGVGLDVARAVVEGLEGACRATSAPGRGTTIELEVPLTLSSLTVLVVEVGGRRASLPLGGVERVVQARPEDRLRTDEGWRLLLDEGPVPFAMLDALLEPGAAPARDRACSAVLLRDGEARAAVGVDRLHGTRTEVLKPLPPSCGRLPLVTGAAFDAQGDPHLVLDPHGLLRAVAAAARGAERAAAHVPSAVLVVDDSLTTRMLEKSILEAAGYRVEIAASGEEGLDRLRAEPFACVLVDVEMPGMDGFEFTARVRADPSRARTPIIIVTSLASPADRRRGEQAGADDYVVKSDFDQGFLLDRIEGLIQR
ncbi:MAG: response regulator [Myxococcales bacterium]|nr:response regulator [Myxococcales bacterium]